MAPRRIGHGHRPNDEQRQRMAAFGRRLRAARTAAGLSAVQVAELLPEDVAVSGGAVRAYERGESMPSEPLVAALETVLLDAQLRPSTSGSLRKGELASLLNEPPNAEDDTALRNEIVELRRRVAALEAFVVGLPARLQADSTIAPDTAWAAAFDATEPQPEAVPLDDVYRRENDEIRSRIAALSAELESAVTPVPTSDQV